MTSERRPGHSMATLAELRTPCCSLAGGRSSACRRYSAWRRLGLPPPSHKLSKASYDDLVPPPSCPCFARLFRMTPGGPQGRSPTKKVSPKYGVAGGLGGGSTPHSGGLGAGASQGQEVLGLPNPGGWSQKPVECRRHPAGQDTLGSVQNSPRQRRFMCFFSVQFTPSGTCLTLDPTKTERTSFAQCFPASRAVRIQRS